MGDRRLFDASAVVDVILGESGEDVSITVVFNEVLLDLTMYEASNALWKIAFARDLLSDDDLQDAIAILERLGGEVRLESAIGVEGRLHRTIQVARRDGRTFYDAAYLSIAERDDLTLVTEDAALRDAAISQGISVESVSDLEK